MNIVLEFKYKGNRSYVHGTDIFNALVQEFANVNLANIDIRFNGVAQNNMLLVTPDDVGEAKVHISWQENGQETKYKLIDSAEQIESRYEYNEEEIVNNIDLDLSSKSAKLLKKTPYTFCENLVAMNKYLLEKLFPTEQGKWYFTRLELDRRFENNQLFHVCLVKNLGFRLTKSEIYVDGSKVGSIYFSMVR